MTGTVTESFLVASAQAGPRNLPYSIHKITIAPLEQDFRHDVSVWGVLFRFCTAAGSISPYGFLLPHMVKVREILGKGVCLKLQMPSMSLYSDTLF